MGGKKRGHGGSKKKHGGNSSKSGGGGSTPCTPRVERKGPASIQEQLKTVSFLARVSAKPGAPCVCSCAPCRGSNPKPCAPFGNFCTVPVDVTLLVLSFLSACCLLGRVALLNSKWRRLAASAELWRPLCLTRWPKLDKLAPDGIRDWLVVYALWHSGASQNMLRLLKFCPLSATEPSKSELLQWHRWWCMNRKLNTCPFGGVELFRRTPLCDVQLYRPNPVMEDAFERCRDELERKYQCGTYTHDLYICVSQAEMRQVQLHGWGVINPQLTCQPGSSGDGEASGTLSTELEASGIDQRWLEDFRARLEIKCRGEYQPEAHELVANTETPGVYAFWYNPGRAILHRNEDATHLMCVSVLVPKSLPHGDKLKQENVVLTYSMSPVNRESVKPKWVADIGPAYKDPNTGWALLELEWVDTVIPTDVPMWGRPITRYYNDAIQQ